MTRKKKTRSLKRIHNVKTGNISKFKKDAENDRQSVRLKNRKKTKSVYQKFLDENPELAAKEQQAAQQANKISSEQVQDPAPVEPKKDEKNQDKTDLLSQLDDKNFNDIY